MLYGFTIFFILLVLILGYWFVRNNHGKRDVPRILPENYRKVLNEKVAFYQKLAGPDQARFEQAVLDFLAHVTIDWVGCEANDLDTVLVASSAVIPIFGFREWRYQNLTSVVVYPATFNHDFEFEKGERNILGMVGNGYLNGQMILSQEALRAGFRSNTPGSNTGIHEFVHLLDKSDGAVDGVPEHLMAHQYVLPWLDLIRKETRRIMKGKSDIDPYGATGEEEFLAVVAEYFFEKPDKMQEKHPELYALLEKIFHQTL